MTLWSHQPIAYDTDLSGVPDYLVARQSPLGPLIFDQPSLLVMEAKQDDFTRGWGQCLAAMLAAQKRKDLPEQTVYGITTNGQVWQCGQLHAAMLTQDPRSFTLEDVDSLGAALHFVFAQCRDQGTRLYSSVESVGGSSPNEAVEKVQTLRKNCLLDLGSKEVKIGQVPYT